MEIKLSSKFLCSLSKQQDKENTVMAKKGKQKQLMRLQDFVWNWSTHQLKRKNVKHYELTEKLSNPLQVNLGFNNKY